MKKCNYCKTELDPKASICVKCNQHQSKLKQILILLTKVSGGISLIVALLTFSFTHLFDFFNKYPTITKLELKQISDTKGYIFFNSGNTDLFVDEIEYSIITTIPKFSYKGKEYSVNNPHYGSYPVKQLIKSGEFLTYTPHQPSAFRIIELNKQVIEHWIIKKNPTKEIHYKIDDLKTFDNRNLFYESNGTATITYYNNSTGMKNSISCIVKGSIYSSFFNSNWSTLSVSTEKNNQ